MEEYLKQLVAFYPVSSSQESVLALLQFAKQHFEEHGLKTEILSYKGVHNLYATTSGKKHTRLLLQGHIDVVPANNQPFSVDDEKYYGRGVYDMLYATACYMQLVADLSDQIHNFDIGFMLSGDEETGGLDGVKAFLEDGYRTQVCILPDAGEGFGTLNIAAKGIYHCNVRIHGKAHHGSRPWEGDGAAAKLVHFLGEFESVFDTSSLDNTTLTIAKLNAGEADNQGPAYADVTLDIRYSDKTDLKRVKQALNELLERYNGEITEMLEGDDYQLDTSHPDVKEFLQRYEEHHGGAIELVKAHGSSDARFLAAKGIPVIMLRPDGGGAHGDAEWVSKNSTKKFYELLKDYVRTIANNGENNE